MESPCRQNSGCVHICCTVFEFPRYIGQNLQNCRGCFQGATQRPQNCSIFMRLRPKRIESFFFHFACATMNCQSSFQSLISENTFQRHLKPCNQNKGPFICSSYSQDISLRIGQAAFTENSSDHVRRCILWISGTDEGL